jgi:hypothetical protein
MKLVALVMCFADILLQLVDEVAHPVHLHLFETFAYEVDNKPRDLRWYFLLDSLTNDQLEIYAHYTILDGVSVVLLF